MAGFREGTRLGRRRLIGLIGGSAGLLAITACMRRDVSTPAPPATQAPAAPKPTAAAQAPDAAKPAPAAQPTAAPAAEAAKPAAGAAKRGGTITAALQNDWLTFDSALNSANSASHFMIFDPLFFYQKNDKGEWATTPGLVEKWEFSGNTATFNLRRGVKFHDGSDWNAEALQWNLDRFINEPKSVAKGVLDGIDWKNPLSVVDPHTVKVNLTGPTPSLLQQLSHPNTFMMSKIAFDKMGAEQAGLNPVGTGPFTFVEWRKNDRVVVKRNESYWMKGADGQPLPYLDGITYRLIIDDTVRNLEMKAGSLDFTELIQGKDVTEAKADPKLTYLEVDWSGNSYRLIFNATGGKFHDNLKLRQAALYAIDREAMAKALGQGVGYPDKYFVRPGSIAFDESLPYYWYDPEKAKGLLREAGFPNGIDVELLVIARALDKLQGEMLKSMLEAVGFRVNLEMLERVAMNQRLLTGGVEFDFTTTRGGSDALDPDPEFRAHFWSKGRFAKARLNDKEVDDAINAASATYDVNERKDRYKTLQRLLVDKAPYGYLWTQKWNWVMNKRIQNLPPLLGERWDFRQVWVSG